MFSVVVFLCEHALDRCILSLKHVTPSFCSPLLIVELDHLVLPKKKEKKKEITLFAYPRKYCILYLIKTALVFFAYIKRIIAALNHTLNMCWF